MALTPSQQAVIDQIADNIATGQGGGSGDLNQSKPKRIFKSKLGMALETLGEKGSNIADSIFHGVVDPFVKVAGSGVRAVQSVAPLLRGDLQEANRIGRTPIFGQKTLEGSSNLENIGTAAQVGSNLVGAGNAVPSIFKGAVTRSTIAGAGAGALQGGGAYLANTEDPNIADFAKNTALGTGVGAVLGGGLAATQKAANLPKTAVRDLQDTYEELFTGTKSAKKTLFKSTAKGQNPAEFGAKKGYIVDISKDGKIDAQPLIRKVTGDVEPLNNSYRGMIEAMDNFLPPNERVSLDLLAEQAKKQLQTAKLKGTGNLPDAQRAIDRIIANLKATYGDDVGLAQLDDIRMGQWSESSSFNSNKPTFERDVNYVIGKAAKTTLSQKTAGTPTANKLLGEIADHYDFMENLRKIDGNVVKGGRLGKFATRAIGMAVGSQGGPIGAIAGERAGNFVSEIALSNSIANPLKRRILESIPRDNPIYAEAQAALQKLIKEGIQKQTTTKALPGSKTIFASPKTQPEPKIEVLPAQKQIFRNPKTGQVNRGYTSQTGKPVYQKGEPKTLKGENSLIQEARKYKSAEEFVKASQQADLMDLSNRPSHRIGRIFSESGDGGVQDLPAIVKQYGEDLKYTPDAKVPMIKSPDETVTVYRSVPKGIKNIEAGDYVSFSKDYAAGHERGATISMKVPAKDVIWQGNDFNEWVYSPESIRKQYPNGLTDIWNKANKKTAKKRFGNK